MSKILLLSATDLEHSQTEIHGVPILITGIGKVNAAVNTKTENPLQMLIAAKTGCV